MSEVGALPFSQKKLDNMNYQQVLNRQFGPKSFNYQRCLMWPHLIIDVNLSNLWSWSTPLVWTFMMHWTQDLATNNQILRTIYLVKPIFPCIGNLDFFFIIFFFFSRGRREFCKPLSFFLFQYEKNMLLVCYKSTHVNHETLLRIMKKEV